MSERKIFTLDDRAVDFLNSLPKDHNSKFVSDLIISFFEGRNLSSVSASSFLSSDVKEFPEEKEAQNKEVNEFIHEENDEQIHEENTFKHKRISYEPEELSQLINSFLDHLETRFTGNDRNDKYAMWRAEIIPFLAQEETEGRKFLDNPAFINQFLWGRDETRFMCRRIVYNIVTQEFTLRIKEIEKIRGVKK